LGMNNLSFVALNCCFCWQSTSQFNISDNRTNLLVAT
jgi:hypothetical protein